MNAERAFNSIRISFGAEEEKVNKTYNTLLDQYQNRKLTDSEMAEQIASRVFPQWEKIRNQIAEVNVSTNSSSKSLHDMLLEFSETRRDSYIALRDGLQNADERKMNEAKNLSDKAEAITKNFKQTQ